jgi:hypothetical protein
MILWCGESIGAAAEWGTTQYHNMAGQVRRDTAERKRQEAAFHQIRQEAALRQHLGAAYDEAGAERRRLAAEAQASSGDLCVAAEQTVRAHRRCHRVPVGSRPTSCLTVAVRLDRIGRRRAWRSWSRPRRSVERVR